MCPECKDEKIGFSDFHNQCIEFQQKGVRQYERLYTCSECGKKYYLRENSRWKWLVIVPGFVWCVLWLFTYIFSFYIEQHTKFPAHFVHLVTFVLPLVAIYWVVSKKSHFIRWKCASSTLVEDEEHWRYH